MTFSDVLAQTVLDSLSAHIAIIDQKGIILETNQAWQGYARKNGLEGNADAIGTNYLDVCENASGDDAEDARKAADGIRLVISGEAREFLYDYPCHSPNGEHWFYMRAVRILYDGPVRVVISHEDITDLKLAEEALKESEAALKEQKQSLEESNIALKVLLKQREADKVELEQKILGNMKKLVFPYIEKLKKAGLKARERTFVEIVDTHLKDIISPFLQRMSAADIFLTPQEIQVASLVKDGKSSKEIAEILSIAETTVHFHRRNLRIKFGIENRKTNLRTYLLSLS
ncbi:transcriptional regulator, PAS domain linked with LysR-type HTH domain [Desulfococcus multivorans]|jgi:PAS domain S-box-containing protein|nr:transcriptional regulator, PAS domain linked with LysR-type HTH domain [Desulfococcus multivorans]